MIDFVIAFYLASVIARLLFSRWSPGASSGRVLTRVVLRVFTQFGLVLLLARWVASTWNGYIVLALLVAVLTDVCIDQLWMLFWRRATDSQVSSILVEFVHVLISVVVSLYCTGTNALLLIAGWETTGHMKHVALTTVAIYFAIVFGGGHVIRRLTRSLASFPPAGESREQLRNAGLYIGWLERFLVLTAIAVQSPTLVGLILTGKSIARFPELKEPRFAEYFLIGTLLSISIAVTGGLLLLWVLHGSIALK